MLTPGSVVSVAPEATVITGESAVTAEPLPLMSRSMLLSSPNVESPRVSEPVTLNIASVREDERVIAFG